MWNNLKSDVYRTFHSRYTYVLFAIILLVSVTTFFKILQSNSMFATFSSENSFVDYLFYLPKSNFFLLLPLIFISMFVTDEYNSGYIKNTYALSTRKWTIIIERYIFSFLMITIFLITFIVIGCVLQLISPLSIFGTLEIGNYIIYCVVEALILTTAASFIMMIIHLTRSKVASILISCVYGMMLLYILLGTINMFFTGNMDWINTYTLYAISGQLPYVFSMEGYRVALLVLLGNTILYNSISYVILTKKDVS